MVRCRGLAAAGGRVRICEVIQLERFSGGAGRTMAAGPRGEAGSATTAVMARRGGGGGGAGCARPFTRSPGSRGYLTKASTSAWRSSQVKRDTLLDTRYSRAQRGGQRVWDLIDAQRTVDEIVGGKWRSSTCAGAGRRSVEAFVRQLATRGTSRVMRRSGARDQRDGVPSSCGQKTSGTPNTARERPGVRGRSSWRAGPRCRWGGPGDTSPAGHK